MRGVRGGAFAAISCHLNTYGSVITATNQTGDTLEGTGRLDCLQGSAHLLRLLTCRAVDGLQVTALLLTGNKRPLTCAPAAFNARSFAVVTSFRSISHHRTPETMHFKLSAGEGYGHA